MSRQHCDLIYNLLPKGATDDEKIDLFIKVMINEKHLTYVNYQKLGIDYSKEELFNAKLKSTGFVEAIETQNSYNPLFKLSEPGLLMIDRFGSFANYLIALKEEEQSKKNENAKIKAEKEERSNLEMQKLRGDNIKLTNELLDYERIKKQRNILFYISIALFIVSVVTIILKLKESK